jgi:hypothetical protein
LCNKLKIIFTGTGIVNVNFIALIANADVHPDFECWHHSVPRSISEVLEKYAITFFRSEASGIIINNYGMEKDLGTGPTHCIRKEGGRSLIGNIHE